LFGANEAAAQTMQLTIRLVKLSLQQKGAIKLAATLISISIKT